MVSSEKKDICHRLIKWTREFYLLLSCALTLALLRPLLLEPEKFHGCLTFPTELQEGRPVKSSERTTSVHFEKEKRASVETTTMRDQGDEIQGKYTPVDCRSFVKNVHVDTDPHGTSKVVVRTKTEKPFLVSLHKEEHDKIRYDIYTYGRYYERQLENRWSDILKKAPAFSHILDVGGNIGYYSLFSASLGAFTIDSFEPNPTNILRFCESIGLNYFFSADKTTMGGGGGDESPEQSSPHIDIWGMGLSQREGELRFFADRANPGAGHFLRPGEKPINATKWDIMSMPVTTLDLIADERGWFDSKPNIEILKVDVENHEAAVILGGSRLFRSGLVKNIFSEVGKEADRQVQIDALQLLIDSGYELAGQGGFRGPAHPSLWQHDDKLAENIIDFVRSPAVTEPYRNLWWRQTQDNKRVADK